MLGVERDANQDTIKKAFRELSKQYHPDHGGDEEKFKEINEAYSVLSDPKKRSEYDNPMPNFGGFPFGFNRAPFRQPDPNAPRQGRNIVLEYEAPLKYFIFGGRLKVNFSFRDICPDCNGTGAEEKEKCSNCNGMGQVMESKRAEGIFIQSSRACPVCHGRGYIASKVCKSCSGSASTMVDKEIELEIPRQIREGQVIGMSGEGRSGINGGPPGDLIVKLYMKLPNPDDLTEEQVKVLEEL